MPGLDRRKRGAILGVAMGMLGRIELEANEDRVLKPYAEFSCRSQGREFEEPVHLYRTDFQIDRERIARSAALAKLEHKSKLAFPLLPERFRSRLGQALGAVRIGRSVARSLGLNEDLVEAIGLGRALGFPPLGKVGTHTLNYLMRDHGGFNPAAQSRRIVDEVEMIFPQFNGLNLCRETREGIYREVGGGEQPSLESQVVDCAYDLVSTLLDLADALETGVMDEELLAGDGLWSEALAKVNERYSRMERMRKRRLVLYEMEIKLVEDLAGQSAEHLDRAAPADAQAARRQARRLVGFSLGVVSALQNLNDYLERHLHGHPDVVKRSQQSAVVLQELFAFYRQKPHLIDDRSQLKIKKEGADRAVCDFLSGLSDAEVCRAYARHVGTDDLLAELVPKARGS